MSDLVTSKALHYLTIYYIVKYVEEELSSSGSDDEYQNEYAYSVDELSNSAVSVNVAGVAVNMLIDSGATCNTINTEFRDKLVSKLDWYFHPIVANYIRTTPHL